jgi:hypothetical protein
MTTGQWRTMNSWRSIEKIGGVVGGVSPPTAQATKTKSRYL